MSMNSTLETQTILPEKVTLANQLRLKSLWIDFMLNMKLDESNENRIRLSSIIETIQLFNSEGKSFVVDAIFATKMEHVDHLFVPDGISCSNISFIPHGDKRPLAIAQRNYFFGRKDRKNPQTLQFFSDLDVFKPHERIGLGSALVSVDDDMRPFLTQEFNKIVHEMKIKYIEAVVTDRTKDKDQGWTTRHYRKIPGWKEYPEGTFTKTTDLDGNVIEV